MDPLVKNHIKKLKIKNKMNEKKHDRFPKWSLSQILKRKIPKYYWIGLFFLNMYTIQAQQDQFEDEYGIDPSLLVDSQRITNPDIQPPDVAAFAKVNFVPVSNYTGRANINIPIYEVVSGSMKVPVNLSYNTSGVKVNDMPSNVGSNWSLNADGVMTQNVKGIVDYRYPRKLNGRTNKRSPAGWIGLAFPYDKETSNQVTFDPKKGDTQPDVYQVSAPGLSTRFIHTKKRNNTNTNIVPVEIEKNGSIIDQKVGILYTSIIDTDGDVEGQLELKVKGITSTQITSRDGIVYDFNSYIISNYALTRKDNPNTTGWDKVKTYKLDRMYDPSTKQEINFIYEEYKNIYFDRIPMAYDAYAHSSYAKNLRLSEITFDGGNVEFIYGHNRQDYPGEKALTEVKITNHLGQVIKRVKMEYSYFQSNIQSGTPQSKRLRLDEVYQIDANNKKLPGHVFTYNTSVQMPPRDSWARDYMGYNNGVYTANKVDPLPNIYFDNALFETQKSVTSGDYMRSVATPYPKTGRRKIGTGNYSILPNENASKAYILTRIQYPTKGYTEFTYEANELRYDGETKKGAGLRIKSQKTVDEYQQEIIENYTYGTGNIGNMPSFANFETNTLYPNLERDHKIFATPQNQIELTDGAFVGYDYVSVSNKFNNGRTEYMYYGHDIYPNVPSVKTRQNNAHRSREWKAYGMATLHLDRDLLRGKLKSKRIYDSNGMLKEEEYYEYTLKEFKDIPLVYDNNYRGIDCEEFQCFGYEEESSLLIERNLLTKVTASEYPINDIEESRQKPNNIYKTTRFYTYDTDLPIITSDTEGILVCGGDQCDNEQQTYISRRYTYPDQGSILAPQNRMATPIAISIHNQNGELRSEDHHFKDFGNNLIALEKITYADRAHNEVIPAEVIRRDHKGNILEIQNQDGTYTSYIFGYGSRYMICKLENVPYTDLVTALADIGSSINTISKTNNNQIILSTTESIRSALPNGFVTAYTHKPLVGVSTIVDQRGRKTHIAYDSFNRLANIKDHDQNFVSKSEYHYKD